MREFVEIVVLPPMSLFILGAIGLLLLLFRVRFGAFLCVLALIIRSGERSAAGAASTRRPATTTRSETTSNSLGDYE